MNFSPVLASPNCSSLQTSRGSLHLRLQLVYVCVLPNRFSRHWHLSWSKTWIMEAKRGSEWERETVKRLGSQYQHHVARCYGVRACVCVCVCDVSLTPLWGLPSGTAGAHLDLCVPTCLRSGSYRIVWAVSVSSSISCYIILKKTIAIKQLPTRLCAQG